MKLFYCLLSVTFYCLFNLSLSESAFPTLFLRLFLSSAPRHYSDILSPKPPGCPHLNRYKRHKMIHNIYKCIQKTFYAASDVRDLYLHSSQQRTVESAVSHFPKWLFCFSRACPFTFTDSVFVDLMRWSVALECQCFCVSVHRLVTVVGFLLVVAAPLIKSAVLV